MTGPGTYRHKPTIVHAMQYTPQTVHLLQRWLADTWPGRYEFSDDYSHLAIETPEGDRDCTLWYWIVAGVAGELYCIHPDIFARIYEPAGGEF